MNGNAADPLKRGPESVSEVDRRFFRPRPDAEKAGRVLFSMPSLVRR
jgi:hypothetical protein